MESQGLVKKLLFPGYADAGSNDAFQSQTSRADDTHSDASTAIHDNRSRMAVDERLSGNLNTSKHSTEKQSQRPPPFFASTRPHLSSTNSTTLSDHGVDEPATPPAVPQSPPKLARKPFSTTRSLSVVATVRGESISSSASEETGNTTENDEGEPDLAKWGNNDDTSDEEPSSNVSLRKDDSNGRQRIQSPWEEEATPEQTAFGKELLFAREKYKKTFGSEVLSTVSENGTVICSADRIAELDAMEEASTQMQLSDIELDDDSSHGDPGGWDNGLNLPVLDGKSVSEDTGDEEKKVADDEEPESLKPSETTKTTSSILSEAIKRIGSGLAGGNRASLSAPNTPRNRSYSLPHASSPHSLHVPARSPSPYVGVHSFGTPARREDSIHRTPSSFLLRSPGSKAFQLASSFSEKRKLLSPRFSSKYRDFHQRSSVLSSKIDENRADISDFRHPNTSTALQIARSCFSYDAYDTSMDDMFEVSMNETDADLLALRSNNSGSKTGHHQLPCDSQTAFHRHNFSESHTPIHALPPIRTSSSWDVGGSSQAPTFRAPSYLRRNPNAFEHWTASSFRSPKRGTGRSPILTDFSQTPRSNAFELQTPQRIEIEREDALDILSCLVERGISLKQESNNNLDPITDPTPQPCQPTEKGLEDEACGEGQSSMISKVNLSVIAVAVEELKQLSMGEAATMSGENNSAHERRVRALDELVRSHEYALEMRRASRSALSWLKSIDRGSETADAKNSVKDPSLNDAKAESGQAAGEKASESMDLLTAKAMLHSCQMELQEKTELSKRLNEELAKCRAEIGRLRSASNVSAFKSPNRSILDESDDISAVDDENDRSFDTTTSPVVGVDDSGFFASSFLNKNMSAELKPPPRYNISTASDSGIAAYRAALEEANEEISKLHEQLEQMEARMDKSSMQPSNFGRASPRNSDQDSVVLNTHDGENFLTEWSELNPPLPPPPDHGLRSPIVAAVLEQWSNDSNLHESLLDWMDQILTGRDAGSIPPLTLSNLDHQVRDGFLMHVLPLLLRRADICVDVKSRVRRLTTHDLSIAVEPSKRFMSLDIRSHFEKSDVGVSSTTHSATTALMSNSAYKRKTTVGSKLPPEEEIHSSRLSYDELVDTGIGVEQPHGLMSALGGALGGLLTRRKPPSLHGTHDSPSSPFESSPTAQSAAAQTAAAAEAYESSRAGRVFLDEGSGSGEEQPYHRVVSAPSGRIGVTFVEYRGHAMVSDVAPDSPLAGWIFPSDILIAIDELPVSGMRVRDIIKVLKDRMGRQRALRVISSHAMNELSLNTSTLFTETPS